MSQVCEVADCGRPFVARGRCSTHYAQWRRREMGLRGRRDQLGWSAVERFLFKVQPDDSGCWLWTGSRGDNGYGKFYMPGSRPMVVAHRWAYEYWVGPIPDGLVIDHLCCRPRCVNPDHLEAVTQTENMRRAFRGKTHCRNGHEITSENTRYDKAGHRQCLTCRREWLEARE